LSLYATENYKPPFTKKKVRESKQVDAASGGVQNVSLVVWSLVVSRLSDGVGPLAVDSRQVRMMTLVFGVPLRRVDQAYLARCPYTPYL
jgi:hypothetical protein